MGSGSSKQLTSADVLNRVRTLSGSSGDLISYFCFMVTISGATLFLVLLHDRS